MTVFQFLDDSVLPNFLKSRNKAKWGDNKIRQQLGFILLHQKDLGTYYYVWIHVTLLAVITQTFRSVSPFILQIYVSLILTIIDLSALYLHIFSQYWSDRSIDIK